MPRWPKASAAATLEADEDDSSASAQPAPRVRVMSAREADKLTGDLAELIQDAGDYLDWSLSHLNANGAQSDVWAFDEEEATKLAEVWLSRARKSAAAAQSVRYILSNWAYIQVAAMLGGRFVETVGFVTENGGLMAPSFVAQRMRFAPKPSAAAAASSAPTPRRAAASAQAQAQAQAQTPARAYADAEAAQVAHMAKVAAMKDGAGQAAQAIAATRPEAAPEASAPPPDVSVLAEEVSA